MLTLVFVIFKCASLAVELSLKSNVANKDVPPMWNNNYNFDVWCIYVHNTLNIQLIGMYLQTPYKQIKRKGWVDKAQKSHQRALCNGMIGVNAEISEVYSSLTSDSMIIALSGQLTVGWRAQQCIQQSGTYNKSRKPTSFPFHKSRIKVPIHFYLFN